MSQSMSLNLPDGFLYPELCLSENPEEKHEISEFGLVLKNEPNTGELVDAAVAMIREKIAQYSHQGRLVCESEIEFERYKTPRAYLANCELKDGALAEQLPGIAMGITRENRLDGIVIGNLKTEILTNVNDKTRVAIRVFTAVSSPKLSQLTELMKQSVIDCDGLDVWRIDRAHVFLSVRPVQMLQTSACSFCHGPAGPTPSR